MILETQATNHKPRTVLDFLPIYESIFFNDLIGG